MPTAAELMANGKGNPLASALDAGVADISQQQQITFTKYAKYTLPIDGSVFWIKITTPKMLTLVINGSLHYATDQRQDEDESPAIKHVIFTAREPVQDFDLVDSNFLYLANFDGFTFAFTGRKSFYVQAALHHYYGDAVYPTMQTQVIDDPSTFIDFVTPVVSNSLPLWLSLNSIFPVYPAFLVPANVAPPYAAVYVDPASTVALAGAPVISSRSSHSQMARDRVRIVIYGERNDVALNYVDYLYDFFENYCEGEYAPGLANMPVLSDLHKTQSELGVIAQKKQITFDVNYYQRNVRDLARQLIESSVVNIIL